MNYYPDAYRFIEITQPTGAKIIKLFSLFRGGYLDGESWRINSGCCSIEDQGDSVVVHGYSGSSYVINKDYQGSLSAFGMSTLQQLLDNLGEAGRLVDYEYVAEGLANDDSAN